VSVAQLDLFARPVVRSEDDAEDLSGYLYVAGDWRTRKEITAAIGWPEDRIRHAAEVSRGTVIFGQRGLKHLRHATPEEARACALTLRSQAAKNTARSIEIEKAYHAFGGAL